MSLVSIIIPTFDNPDYLNPCVQSILTHRVTPGLAHIFIVNNGHPKSIAAIWREAPEITVLDAGKNLGWEGGLKLGLEHATTPFVVFMNDDTYIPVSSSDWLPALLQKFADPNVAAVGPSSNCVMGPQNAFIPSTTYTLGVNFLIGFCMMVRRSALDAVGSVDDSMPNHGDDLDLSIRFRKAGHKLIADKSVFVYHHGFKTGQREHGAEWNSVQMTEKTNHWLIKKHGLKEFIHYIFNPIVDTNVSQTPPTDTEGDLVRKFAVGEVIEVGCGNQKTVEPSLGLDIIPKGQPIPGLVGKHSIADMVSDISEPLPVEDNKFDTLIARHILEHLVDTTSVIKDWGRVLKPGGRLILAVPDEDITRTIPLNYQHVDALNQKSLKNQIESLGFKTLELMSANNNVSFIGVFEKNGHH